MKNQITHKINNHSRMFLYFETDRRGRDYYGQYLNRSKVDIKYSLGHESGEVETFIGYVENISISEHRDKYFCKIEAFSNSKKMDKIKRNISYQDKNITLRQIFDSIQNRYNGVEIKLDEPGLTIGHFEMQYDETDWEFILRLASRYNKPVANVAGKIVVGFHDIKEIREDMTKVEVGVGKDFIKPNLEFNLKTTNVYGLMEHSIVDVFDEEVRAVITDANIYFEKDIVKCEYKMLNREKYYVKPIINKSVRGAMVEGKVVQVGSTGDVASLKLNFYQNLQCKINSGGSIQNEMGDLISIPYMTEYSRSHTGLFTTPEAGDNVAVFFPDSNAFNACVIGAVNNDNSVRFSNENYRDFITNQGTKIIMDENNILLKSGNSVEINSNNINFIATDNSNIKSGNIKFSAQTTNIEADSELAIKGETTDVKGSSITIGGGGVKMG